MYSKAKEDKLIFEVPGFALFKDTGGRSASTTKRKGGCQRWPTSR